VLHAETVFEVDGVVIPSPQAPGGFEVHEPAVRVLSPAAAPPPIDLRLAELKEQLPTVVRACVRRRVPARPRPRTRRAPLR
jgi:nondiscriminating aspartyl-tRNA synthetase